MAQNIRDLAAVDCKVILDDVSYVNESPFQDGTISQAANDVSAKGVELVEATNFMSDSKPDYVFLQLKLASDRVVVFGQQPSCRRSFRT